MPRDNKENNSSHFDRSGYSSNGTYRDARESDTLGRNYHTSSAIYEANPNVMRRQSDEDTESSNKYTSRSRHHQYQYDHRGSTSSKMGNGRGSDCSRRSANHSDNEGSAFAVPHSDKVIALFGAYGVTGHYFLKLALEAGYHVRVLLLPGIDLEDIEGNENLTIVTGTFDDDQKIRRVVRKAAFVVCMLNDCEKSAVQNHNGTQCSNLKFIQQLLPILQDIQLCQVLLYQVRIQPDEVHPMQDDDLSSTLANISRFRRCLRVYYGLSLVLCFFISGFRSRTRLHRLSANVVSNV